MWDLSKLPRDWRVVKLGDIAEIAFSGVDKKKVSGELPIQLCNYTDVFYNRLIRPEIGFMKATATQKEYMRWALQRGDVLFTKDSETPDEIGISAYVTENMPNVLCGYHLGMARSRTGVLDGQFLAEVLGSQASRREFARIANGITRFGLTLDSTRSLSILLPPLSEQRAIVAVLDAIDEAIERTEAVISATQRLRDALLHELLTLGVPGWHSKWRNVPRLGMVPVDWEVVRFGEICEPPKYGAGSSARPFDETLPRYVRITDLAEDGRLRTDDPRSADPASVVGYELRSGDLLFARSGATVGKTYLYQAEDGPCVFAGYLIRFRVRPDVALAKFAEIYTRSWPYRRWVNSMLRAGAQPNINASEYSSLPIPLPPLSEQRAIATVLTTINETIECTRNDLDRLRSFKLSISDALLEGRLSTRSQDWEMESRTIRSQ